jgi:hypothetical protein
MIGDHQVVCVNAISLARDALEQTRLMQAPQLDGRLGFFMDRNDLDGRDVREERPNDEAGAIAERMHTQQRVGRPMLHFDKALHFIGRQDHAGHCGPVTFKGHKKTWVRLTGEAFSNLIEQSGKNAGFSSTPIPTTLDCTPKSRLGCAS